MIVRDWVEKAKTKIDGLDAELIAMRCFGYGDRSQLAAHGDDEIMEPTDKAADMMLEKRANGMPLAYILSEKEFYGRRFGVSREVLIPRPETESLVELVKGLDLPEKPSFLEIGTGSGCIAITLALEFPNATVTATDISREALYVARQNDGEYEAGVEFVEVDLLDDELMERSYDVLVANLPYVNPKWDWLDMKTLEFEPMRALFALTEDGLSVYHRLFSQLEEYREKNTIKYVVVEADPSQHEAMKKIAEEAGYLFEKAESFGLVFRNNR